MRKGLNIRREISHWMYRKNLTKRSKTKGFMKTKITEEAELKPPKNLGLVGERSIEKLTNTSFNRKRQSRIF